MIFNLTCQKNRLEDVCVMQEKKLALVTEKFNALKIHREQERNHFKKKVMQEEKDASYKNQSHKEDLNKMKEKMKDLEFFAKEKQQIEEILIEREDELAELGTENNELRSQLTELDK